MRSRVPSIVLLSATLLVALVPGMARGDAPSPRSPSPFVGQRAPTVTLPEGPLPPGTGDLPMPIDLSHLKGDRMPDGVDAALLPDTWDWRQQGMVTRVQDQGDCGSCYAFGTLASFESKLLIDGDDTFDFSENHVKECLWEEANGWRYPDGSPVGSCDGGNWGYVANLLSQTGAVLESCDPYRGTDVQCKTTCPYQKTALDWSVLTGEGVPDTEVLKAYIYQQPVAVSIYVGDNDPWRREFSDYDGSYTLYYRGTETPNHGVLIVGWDENRSHPGGRGAWIVKNSWGRDWGDRGFFYIAYGSASIGTRANFPHLWQDYDATGGIMYHDDAGWNDALGADSTTLWGLATFDAPKSTYVTRVEFWTTDRTTDVDVYVYDGFDGRAVAGLLWSREGLSYDTAGYHGVSLDAPLRVMAGDDVVAVVKFTNESYEYPLPFDQRAPCTRGGNYVSITGADGGWMDLCASQFEGDVGIRLRTSDAGPPTPTPTSTLTGTLTPTPTATSTRTPTPTETRPGMVWRTYLPILLKGFSPAPPPATATPTPSPTLPSGECVTILREDFEGPFPGPWNVGDLQPGDGEYYWSRRDCRPYEGLYSGWAVGGGADGAGLPCGSNYPNNVDSEMTYGPFSLADAGAADLSVRVWLNAQWGHQDERVFWGATDGQSIVFASRFGQTDGWIEQVLDLNALVGRPQVWVTIGFTTDSSGTRPEGAYVDNIVLRKCPSAPTPPTKTPTATPTATRPGEPTPTRTATRTRVPTATPTRPTTGWTTIVSEDFEGLFPGEWMLVDNIPGYGEYGWGKRDCRPYGGAYSGWAVGAGAQGSQLSCGSNYPDHAESWMVYGPFSLVDATAAELAFKVWLNSELDYDYVVNYASIDGQNFYGWYRDGRDRRWEDAVFDLRDVYVLGDLMGQPEVWVALAFESDDGRHFPEGCYVDDIVLRKCTSAQCAGEGGATASQSAASGRGKTMRLPGPLPLAARVMPAPPRRSGDLQ
jgi:C1A family cysteine protease